MKSQIYNLLFLVFLILNGSLDYTGILKDTALNKEPSDFFKFNDQKIIFDGKIVKNSRLLAHSQDN